MTALFLGLVLLMGEPDDQEVFVDKEVVLRVKEADAIIGLYEARLRTAKIRVRRDEVVKGYCQDRAERLRKLLATAATAEQEYLAAKRDFEVAALEVEQDQSEVEEAEMDLELAKVRRRLVASGSKSIFLKVDQLRVRHR